MSKPTFFEENIKTLPMFLLKSVGIIFLWTPFFLLMAVLSAIPFVNTFVIAKYQESKVPKALIDDLPKLIEEFKQ